LKTKSKGRYLEDEISSSFSEREEQSIITRMTVPFDQMSQKMNYWEMQRSFWKTPAGIAIWFALLLAIIGGGLLALNLFVSPYPVIEFFDADPVAVNSSEASNLSWSVTGATQVELNPEIGRVEPKGFVLVFPNETTVYTLTAVNGSRNRSLDAKVIVRAKAL